MKKIIMALILMFPFTVKAETFFTDYYLKESGVKDYREESETIIRKEKILYNNYNYKRVNENYYLIYHNLDESPLIDPNDTIMDYAYTKYMNSFSFGPFCTFKVEKINDIRYLKLRSFFAPKAIIKSIKIFNKDSEINYKNYFTNYKIGNLLNSNTELIIDLGKVYAIKDIRIVLDFEDDSLSRIAFMLNVYKEYQKYTSEYAYYSNEIIRIDKTENYEISFLESTDFNNYLITHFTWINKRNYLDTKEVFYYKYLTKYYKYYDEKINYLNEYSEEPLFNCFLDYNDSIKVYDYYERKYIEVKDEINSINDMNNLVINSNMDVNKIKMESNIDINNNGEYLIIINYGDEKFYKKIRVNINRDLPQSDDSKIEQKAVVNDVSNSNQANNHSRIKTIKPTSTTTIIYKSPLVINKKRERYSKSYLYMFPIFIVVIILGSIIHKKKF